MEDNLLYILFLAALFFFNAISGYLKKKRQDEAKKNQGNNLNVPPRGADLKEKEMHWEEDTRQENNNDIEIKSINDLFEHLSGSKKSNSGIEQPAQSSGVSREKRGEVERSSTEEERKNNKFDQYSGTSFSHEPSVMANSSKEIRKPKIKNRKSLGFKKHIKKRSNIKNAFIFSEIIKKKY